MLITYDHIYDRTYVATCSFSKNGFKLLILYGFAVDQPSRT